MTAPDYTDTAPEWLAVLIADASLCVGLTCAAQAGLAVHRRLAAGLPPECDELAALDAWAARGAA